MSEFSYTNYHTIYESVGDVEHEMGEDSCFHTITKDAGLKMMNNTITIRFYSTLDYIRDNENNNYCPFSEDEIRQYLHIIQTYRHFEFTLSKDESNANDVENSDDYDDDGVTYPYFELEVKINDSLLWNKFILKMIRPLYEYPFNFALRDTFKLMRIPKFREYGLFNIYMMVGYLYKFANYISVCDDQFICSCYRNLPIFIKKADLINRIETTSQKHLRDEISTPDFNNVVSYSDSDNGDDICDWLENRYFNTMDVREAEYWFNDEMFEERMEIYSELIKRFIKE